MGRAGDRARAAADHALDRVRHARHPLHGLAKWSLIGFQSLVGLFFLFCLVNLVLTFAVQRPRDILPRLERELAALHHAPLDGRPMPDGGFAAVYGDALGATPTAADIRAYFDARFRQRRTLLDQVMVQYMADNFGGLDSRSFPPGVYVGVRALGPDGLPFVPVTKYLAQYVMFPRHAYLLVVPETGTPTVFSASQSGKFDPDADLTDRLSARIGPFGPDAYDYPSSGQTIHELALITRDPEEIAAAEETLRDAEAQVRATDIRYGVLAPNSNTVVGCILEQAGVMTQAERSATLLALRAPGVGAACR